MAKKITDVVSFRTGSVASDQYGFLLAGHDDLDAQDVAHTNILQWKSTSNTPGGFRLSWNAISGCISAIPSRRFLALSQKGDFLVMGQGDRLLGTVMHGSEDKQRPFSSVREAAGRVYAIGMRGLIYRWEGGARWRRIDAGVASEASFEAMDGPSDDELYFVGWNGCICWLDHGVMNLVESPTNVVLASAHWAEDGFLYCVGQDGIILRGRGNRWDILAEDQTSENLWDVVSFLGKIYVSSTTCVMQLDNGNLHLVGFGDDQPSTCYHLSAAEKTLWSIGSKDVFKFDGKTWARVY